MTLPLRDRLYNLLPVIYRQRDEAAGLPLRALLAVIENEFNALETDIAAGYDNWFVETADAWVLPYLADLVGIDNLMAFEQPLFGQRRLVANHVAYQRRKGLATILAHFARDVSGWPAYVADTGQRVAQTQSVKNVKPQSRGIVDLRQVEPLSLLGTAFDTTPRSVDVRRVDADIQSGSQPGRAAPNALTLYLWRLQSYPIRQAQAGVPARIRRGSKTRHFTFDPLGRELPLFIQPEALDGLSAPMRPAHFPQPLTRAMLAADLPEVDFSPHPADNSAGANLAVARYYGPEQEIAIWKDGRLIPPSEILVARIDHPTAYWDDLTEKLRAQGEVKTVVVDPENGRLLLDQPAARDGVTVNYSYGFSGDLGSGPYLHNQPDANDEAARRDALIIEIAKSGVSSERADSVKAASSLKEALDLWQQYCKDQRQSNNSGPQAIIRFLDSGTYDVAEPLRPQLPSGCYLSIEAAPGERPVILVEKGEKLALGLTEPEMAAQPELAAQPEMTAHDRRLRLQGLLVMGAVALPDLTDGKLDFQIQGCTLLDGLELGISERVLFDLKISASLIASVRIEMLAAAAGSGRAPLSGVTPKGALVIEDSIVSGGVSTVISPAPPFGFEASVSRSTIFGKTHLASAACIEDAILLGGLHINQIGDVPDPAGAPNKAVIVMRYSYAPETNLAAAMTEHCILDSHIQPVFTSIQPHHPGYAQLRASCPREIREGASDGAEMGAFNSLQVNRRDANLKRMLPDYLPLGHNLGIITVT